jgi:hypothetical protein
MGFYVPDLSAVAPGAKAGTECARQEQTHPRPKTRVGGSRRSPALRARRSATQPLESHRPNWPTPTATASGVRYYGYRFYSPELGRWLSRDPIGEEGFEQLRDEPVSFNTIRLLKRTSERAVRLSSLLRLSALTQSNNQEPRSPSSLTLSQLQVEAANKRILHDPSFNPPYAFVGNNSLNAVDPQGLHGVCLYWCYRNWFFFPYPVFDCARVGFKCTNCQDCPKFVWTAILEVDPDDPPILATFAWFPCTPTSA